VVASHWCLCVFCPQRRGAGTRFTGLSPDNPDPGLIVIPRYLRATLVAALVFVPSCENGITDASCERCDEVRVRTNRGEYRNNAIVEFSVTNRTSTEMRYDWCSVQLAGRTNSDSPFSTVYSPARRCGFGAGQVEVLAHMRLIAPGATLVDSQRVSGAALQGQYRLHTWFLDEMGLPEAGNPIVSNTFDVFPAAEASVSR